MTQAVENETVKFYASAGQKSKEQGGGQYPSSMIISISGGQRMMGQNGIPTKAPLVEVRFNNGHYETDDPEIIAGLRKLMLKDGSITEDYELYCSRVLTNEQRVRRSDAKSEEVLRENSRLKAKLKELEGKRA